MTQLKRGILIPIRLASERLPGKALLDVGGRPALHHLLDRCLACRYVERGQIVVCTTREASDDPLVDAVEAWGARAWRGPTDDLIRRFSEAVEGLGFNHIVEADGDDLFCATEYMDLCFEALVVDPALDVVTCDDLPLGVAPRAFTCEAMRKVLAVYASEQNDTAFFHLFTHTGICRTRVLAPLLAGHRHNTARLTLDYAEDLAFFRCLAETLGAPGHPATLSETVAFLNTRPDVVEINSKMTAMFRRRQSEKANISYRGADGRLQNISV